MQPPPLPPGKSVYQIGVVVADLEAGMERYSRLFGLTGWKRMDTDYQARYRDWRGRIANRNAFAQWGAIHLEMIEPGIGEGNAKEWLRERGEGIFHIGIATDDLDRDAEGTEIVFETDTRRPDGGRAIVHLDTVDSLGCFTELTYRPMAERLAAWVATPED
ncbi:MAG: VOC family protein [Sphingomonadaceae bacterium]|nr:VOC family protein [Sphingomonadaceae bacterium]